MIPPAAPALAVADARPADRDGNAGESEGPDDGPDDGDGLAAREVALDALAAVLRHHRPLDESLDRAAGPAGLSSRDRGLAVRLATATLRHLGEIDARLDRCLAEPLPDRAAPTRDILRLGACQLLILDTPAHAAVDTAVNLARRRHQARYLKLVNAVLRRIARDGAAPDGAGDPVRANTPDWLFESWVRAYGDATARAIAAAHRIEPALDLTPHPAAGDPAVLAARLGATLLPTGSLRLGHAGPVAALPGYTEGAWWVQDAAAALPVRLLGAVAGLRIADLCAAPGGKTAQLAAAGARVIAVDRIGARLDRLAENLSRLGLGAEVVVADAAAWRPGEPVDGVLLDAPCSSTGTIRRHPDIAWLKRPADVASLAANQCRLLAAAAEMVRPDGLVVYCVCSLQPEEGPDQLAAIRAAGLPLEPVPIDPGDPLAEFADGDGALRTLPSHWPACGGLDGFYAVRLRRR